MRVWIDQDLCTGDGICSEICPDLFYPGDEGLWHVKERGEVGDPKNPRLSGPDGLANIPDDILDTCIEAAEECPGECIFIEADDD